MSNQHTDDGAISTKRDKDVLFSIVLSLMSVALIVYSIVISVDAMRTFPDEVEFYTAPGFSVLVIAVAVLLLSIYLFVLARKDGGSLRWLKPSNLRLVVGSRRSRRTVTVFFYFFLYMIVLWNVRIPLYGRPIPFWLNTFFFLFLMMFTFRAAKLRTIVIISLVVAISLDYTFSHLLRVPLP